MTEYEIEHINDEDVVRIIQVSEKPMTTLDGEKTTVSRRSVIAELPDDWGTIKQIISELVDTFGPEPPYEGNSISQQMDEAYNR